MVSTLPRVIGAVLRSPIRLAVAGRQVSDLFRRKLVRVTTTRSRSVVQPGVRGEDSRFALFRRYHVRSRCKLPVVPGEDTGARDKGDRVVPFFTKCLFE